MYYPCSENKGADQLRGYREADLRLCFRIGKNPVFSRCGSHDICRKRFLLMSSYYLSRHARKPVFGVSDWVRHKMACTVMKQARGLKFWLFIVEEELYYPSSESKGADQLRSYCEADLRLCFSQRLKSGVPTMWLI